MTAELLSASAGVVLSLAFSYIPGLEAWYGKLDPNFKRLVMLALLFVVGLGALGLACSGFGANFGVELACDESGGVLLLKAFLAAAIANQTAYKLSPQ